MEGQFDIKKDKVVLTGFLSEFREALENEIEQIKKSGQSSALLYSGRRKRSRLKSGSVRKIAGGSDKKTF